MAKEQRPNLLLISMLPGAEQSAMAAARAIELISSNAPCNL